MNQEFRPFPKMARLARDIIITEKIDGTNASIFIDEDGAMLAGSRTRWITPGDDNYGFARWAEDHKGELLALGPGHHFGEWWGRGIQRNYGMNERRFSLFNVQRWCRFMDEPLQIKVGNEYKLQDLLPSCCDLVPTLYRGRWDDREIDDALAELKIRGSLAAPGFGKPEGVVIFHTAANLCFKKTIDGDGHKGMK